MESAEAIHTQTHFWNNWNETTRERHLDEVSLRQARVVRGWLGDLGRRDLDVMEVGCGAGWFCEELAQFGKVTATDLSDEVLARAQQRLPHIRFVAGDFMELPFAEAGTDVIVTLEVLSHIADQPGFIAKLARHLRPGGYLMMATQNRPVLQNFNNIPPPSVGQLRKWVDKNELRALLESHFDVLELFSVTPRANKGILRIVNSRTFNAPIRAVLGSRVDEFKEKIGLGWTLMALARKRWPSDDNF